MKHKNLFQGSQGFDGGSAQRERGQAEAEQRDEGEAGGRHRVQEELHPVERVQVSI
jgi:hypothetical protein